MSQDIFGIFSRSDWTEARMMLCLELVNIRKDIEILRQEIKELSDEQRKISASDSVQNVKIYAMIAGISIFASTLLPKLLDLLTKK